MTIIAGSAKLSLTALISQNFVFGFQQLIKCSRIVFSSVPRLLCCLRGKVEKMFAANCSASSICQNKFKIAGITSVAYRSLG